MWGVASSPPPPPAPYAPAPADAMSLETAMGSTMDSSSLLYLGVCLALLSSVSQIGKGLQKLGVDTLVRSMSYRARTPDYGHYGRPQAGLLLTRLRLALDRLTLTPRTLKK